MKWNNLRTDWRNSLLDALTTLHNRVFPLAQYYLIGWTEKSTDRCRFKV